MNTSKSLDEPLIDLYEAGLLHGEAQANGVLPTQSQREQSVVLAKQAIVEAVEGIYGDSDGLREFAGLNLIKSLPQAQSKRRGELSDEFRQLFADAIPSEHAKRKRLKAAVRQWLLDNVPTEDKNVRQFLEEL